MCADICCNDITFSNFLNSSSSRSLVVVVWLLGWIADFLGALEGFLVLADGGHVGAGAAGLVDQGDVAAVDGALAGEEVVGDVFGGVGEGHDVAVLVEGGHVGVAEAGTDHTDSVVIIEGNQQIILQKQALYLGVASEVELVFGLELGYLSGKGLAVFALVALHQGRAVLALRLVALDCRL